MPPECGAVNPDIPGVVCNKDKHEGLRHTFKYNTGEVNWVEKPKESKPLTMEQLTQVIGDHETKLQQTLDSVKNSRSLETDMVNTFVPMFQTQLFIIKEALKKIKSD